jgi:hypothetical protein
MKMRRTLYAVMITVCCMSVVAGTGCGIAPSGEPLATVTDDIEGSNPAERATMTLALRSEDLVDLAAMEAALNAACPVEATCPGFDSCAAWSATTSCGTRVCGGECTADCIGPEQDFCFFGIERSTSRTRFRVCFNAQGQSCTELQVSTTTTCQTSTAGDCCRLSPGTCRRGPG